MRCPTTHGPFQCDRDAGHPGECETEHGPRARLAIVRDPPRDLDSGRELKKAFRRIEVLEKALEEIRTTPCEAVGSASCLCCLHDRMVATAALKGDA